MSMGGFFRDLGDDAECLLAAEKLLVHVRYRRLQGGELPPHTVRSHLYGVGIDLDAIVGRSAQAKRVFFSIPGPPSAWLSLVLTGLLKVGINVAISATAEPAERHMTLHVIFAGHETDLKYKSECPRGFESVVNYILTVLVGSKKPAQPTATASVFPPAVSTPQPPITPPMTTPAAAPMVIVTQAGPVVLTPADLAYLGGQQAAFHASLSAASRSAKRQRTDEGDEDKAQACDK